MIRLWRRGGCDFKAAEKCCKYFYAKLLFVSLLLKCTGREGVVEYSSL